MRNRRWVYVSQLNLMDVIACGLVRRDDDDYDVGDDDYDDCDDDDALHVHGVVAHAHDHEQTLHVHGHDAAIEMADSSTVDVYAANYHSRLADASLCFVLYSVSRSNFLNNVFLFEVRLAVLKLEKKK